MPTSYPGSKQTLPDETPTTPVIYTKQNILYDTVEALEDYTGYTNDLPSASGTLTGQIKHLQQFGPLAFGTVSTSGSTLTLTSGFTVVVTGTPTITDIDTANQLGRHVTLYCPSAATFVDGGNLDLVGNFVGPGVLMLWCDGTTWREKGRAGAGITRIAVQEEGADLPIRNKINFRGALVTATDDAANDRINVDVTGGAGGHTIQDEGVDLPSRLKLNFMGAAVTVSDDVANNRTNVVCDGGVQIQDEGVSVGFATTLNFVGVGVAATSGSNAFTISVPGPTIQDEGLNLPNRPTINFVGTGVSASDDAVNNRTVVAISAGGSAHIIQDEGVTLAQRTKLNFVGAGVTASDDAPNDATVVTISGVPQGTAGGDLEGAYPNPTVKAFLPRRMAVNKTSAPVTSAALEIAGTDGALLVPRLTTAQRDALTATDGMIIYNTTTAQFERYQAGAWGAFAGGGTAIVVQDEGAALGSFTTLNFTGAGVTASDAGGGVATINVPGGGGGGGGATVYDILKLLGGS